MSDFDSDSLDRDIHGTAQYLFVRHKSSSIEMDAWIKLILGTELDYTVGLSYNELKGIFWVSPKKLSVNVLRPSTTLFQTRDVEKFCRGTWTVANKLVYRPPRTVVSLSHLGLVAPISVNFNHQLAYFADQSDTTHVRHQPTAVA